MIYLIVTIILLLSALYFNNDKKEGFTNDEAIKNVASLYNSGMATVSNLKATGNITGHNVIVNDALTTPNIKTEGRMHISGGELLVLLNKAGVSVSSACGGNGNLTVDGTIGVGKGINTPELNTPNIKNAGRLHISGDELLYLLNKNGVIIGEVMEIYLYKVICLYKAMLIYKVI